MLDKPDKNRKSGRLVDFGKGGYYLQLSVVGLVISQKLLVKLSSVHGKGRPIVVPTTWVSFFVTSLGTDIHSLRSVLGGRLGGVPVTAADVQSLHLAKGTATVGDRNVEPCRRLADHDVAMDMHEFNQMGAAPVAWRGGVAVNAFSTHDGTTINVYYVEETTPNVRALRGRNMFGLMEGDLLMAMNGDAASDELWAAVQVMYGSSFQLTHVGAGNITPFNRKQHHSQIGCGFPGGPTLNGAVVGDQYSVFIVDTAAFIAAGGVAGGAPVMAIIPPPGARAGLFARRDNVGCLYGI